MDDTRVASWGDFDADGHLDLFIGFPFEEGRINRLYRNEGDGRAFTDVAAEVGVEVSGVSRQASFVDYDNDGDLDLFVALRDRTNCLFRNDGANDGARFVDVSEASGIDDPRRTVGAVWFDMDEDGDLDCFIANQNGDADGVFRNDGGHFVDVASALGMDGGERSEDIGGVGPSVIDYDVDGDLDLFVAMYGPDVLWRNDGGGRFVEVDAGPVNEDYHSDFRRLGRLRQRWMAGSLRGFLLERCSGIPGPSLSERVGSVRRGHALDPSRKRWHSRNPVGRFRHGRRPGSVAR